MVTCLTVQGYDQRSTHVVVGAILSAEKLLAGMLLQVIKHRIAVDVDVMLSRVHNR